MAVTVATVLFAKQVYTPPSFDVTLLNSNVSPVRNGSPLVPFPLYHWTEGGGFPSTGQVRAAWFPWENEKILLLSVTCGESKRKEHAGFFCQKLIINTCTY